jgi:hypothetical protein
MAHSNPHTLCSGLVGVYIALHCLQVFGFKRIGYPFRVFGNFVQSVRNPLQQDEE